MESLSRNNFDLVITEIATGEISGLTLLERVKSLKPRMPVVIMTSSNHADSVRSAFRSGADDYLFAHEAQEARSRIAGLLQRLPAGLEKGPVGSICSGFKENILDMLMVMSHDIGDLSSP